MLKTPYFLLNEVPGVSGAALLIVLTETLLHALSDLVGEILAIHEKNDRDTQLQDEQ